MKIFAALKQIDFVLKLFAAAGFSNFSAAFEAKNENALKDFINSQAKTTTVEKIVDKLVEPTDEQLTALVTAELREQITAAGFTLAADADPIATLKTGLAAHQSLSSQLSTLNTGLLKAGVTLKAADEKKGVQESDIVTAIEGRVSMKAAELNGRLGTPPVDPSLNNNPAAAPKGEKSELKGLAKVQAAFAAESLAAKSRRN